MLKTAKRTAPPLDPDTLTRLQDVVREKGPKYVAQALAIPVTTVARAAAGVGVRPSTAAAFRLFFQVRPAA